MRPAGNPPRSPVISSPSEQTSSRSGVAASSSANAVHEKRFAGVADRDAARRERAHEADRSRGRARQCRSRTSGVP
jgi:hypothetical protein